MTVSAPTSTTTTSTTTKPTTPTSVVDRLDDVLDRVESRLPLIPRRIFRLQRAIADAGFGASRSILDAIFNSADRVERSARTGVKTVTGQARAQAERTAATAESEAASLLGRAERSVEGESSERLEQWSKSELYERAQELDIDGRSSMSKDELVEALRSR